MPLLDLIVPLIMVGLVLWLINRYIPMASSIKNILNVVVVMIVAVWVLQAMGLWGNLSSFRLHIWDDR
jgi:hypothetical protein